MFRLRWLVLSFFVLLVGRPGAVTPVQARPAPAVTLRKGICFDRRLFELGTVDLNKVITPEDIANCRQMGFDHVKLLFSPERLITRDGHFDSQYKAEFKNIVNEVVDGGLNCIVCIHPGSAFKTQYLGNSVDFEKLLRWYKDLGSLIASDWPRNRVALQLMTEPFGRPASVSWDWMSNQMIAAARSTMPEHTILTSTEIGSVDAMKDMTPTDDPNVIYTFTDYDPLLIGLNALPGMGGFLPYLRNLPYPADPAKVDAARIEDVIEAVPDNLKAQAREALRAFLAGRYDRDPGNPNRIGGHYNADRAMVRMKPIYDWSVRHGGVPVMCVEFGCYDARHRRRNWPGGAAPSVGEEDRLRFISDLRKSFDSNGIGWTYWSYNEDFSVYKLDRRQPMASPDSKHLGPSWYDYRLLTEALGLTVRLPGK